MLTEANAEPIVNMSAPIATHRHLFSSIAMRRAWWMPVLVLLAGLTAGSADGQPAGKQGQPAEKQGQPAEKQGQRLAELMQRLSARKTSTAAFREVKELSELTIPLELKGTLYYKAPDVLRKTVTFPRRETYSVEGNVLTLFRNGERQGQYALDQYPRLQAFVESIRATLAGDLASLRRFYRVSLRGDRRLWLLSLLPRQSSLAEVITRIDIQGRGIDLEVIVIQETGGNKSTMTILTKPDP